MTKTSGVMITRNRIISQVNLPRHGRRRLHLLAGEAAGHFAEIRLRAGATMTAVAEPLSTLVPRKQMFVCSMDETFVRGSRASVFSTGRDSPAGWLG